MSSVRFARLLDLARVDLAVSATDAGLALLDEANALPQCRQRTVTRRNRCLDSLRAQLLRQRGDDKQALDVAEKAYLEVQASIRTQIIPDCT